jgi:hypothetical protein
MDQLQTTAVRLVFAVSAQTVDGWGKSNRDKTYNKRKDWK